MNALFKNFNRAYLLVLFLPFVILNCTDSSEPNEFEFEYNFPDDCCTTIDWSTNFESYDEGVKILYANVITPNSETENSVYLIHTNELVDSIASTRIYTQEGDLVFENSNFEPNNPDEGWDGLVNGNLIEGAYKVIIEIVNDDGTILTDEIIVCVLECQIDFVLHYEARNMDFTNCIWNSQHDGEGGYDFADGGEDCIQ